MEIEGLWNCLPEVVIQTLYEYLSYRDVEAASQTCKRWYATFLNSSRFKSEIEFVIYKETSEAFAVLSRNPSRCKKIRLMDPKILELSEEECEELLNRWKPLAKYVEYITFDVDDVFYVDPDLPKTIHTKLVSCCPKLLSLTLYYYPEELFSDSNRKFKNFASLRRLEINIRYIQYIVPDSANTLSTILTKTMPNLEHLSLTGNEKKYGSPLTPSSMFLRFNQVRTLTSLDFSNTEINTDEITGICKTPDLRLISLILENCFRIDDSGFEGIAAHQTELESLNINNARRITDKTFSDICYRLKRLKMFTFENIGITHSGLKRVTDLKEIRKLNLSCLLNGQPIAFDKPLGIQLTHLDLRFSNFQKPCLKLMFTKLVNLQCLNVRPRGYVCTDDDLFRDITTNLVNLVVLNLPYCNITDQGLTGIDEAGITIGPSLRNLKRLKELNLDICNKLSDSSLIFGVKFLHLKKASFAQWKVTDEALKRLAAQPSPFSLSIEELFLPGCTNITDYGLAQLLPQLKRLRMLSLRGCPLLTQNTIETVKTYCQHLRCLDVYDCGRIPYSCYDELKRDLPLLRVYKDDDE